MRVTIEIDDCHDHHHHGYPYRLVPGFRVSEQVLPPGERPKSPSVSPVARDHHKKGFPLMADLNMTDIQQCDCTLQFLDKRGNPTTAPTGATATWGTDSPSILDIGTVSADTFTCTVKALGPLTAPTSPASLSVSVADGSGNSLAAGVIAVNITSSAPAVVNITPGVPSDQP